MRSGRAFAVSATLAVAASLAFASSASADPSPQSRDIVGAGSDTSEVVVQNLADGAGVGAGFLPGYNGTANARLVSFNATGTTPIVLKAGTAAVTRPNGSGAGKSALYGATNNPSINFARSSSGPSSAENAAGLWHVPFALDTVRVATATTSNAPASLTAVQLVGIYNGTITNWSQVGGSSGVIVPMIPQANSGTRNFFLAQLQAANGGTAISLAASVQSVQEHDSAPLSANANAVGPFSVARFNTDSSGIKLAGGFSADRALYNVVRNADRSAPWFSALFGPDGFVCSGGGLALVQAAGFQQLAGPFDGGVCGVATQTATTNFSVN
ncbi:substrate-binding domain-containing protein [Cellulomonas sp.]|uniref:substrate-binding domain-containing protein n=1 Tax=Cellulomonas sp. TaxID=40001 RepID=UPI003BAB9DE3